MNVSVVVIAKNEEKCIGRCLDILRRQTQRPEIIVVDGHSTDRTFSIAKRYADKVVKDHGRGVADARNVGWKLAKHEIVAFCDADCIPPLNWIENISKLMDGNVCISGPLRTYDGDILMKVYYKIWTNYMTRLFGLLGFHVAWASNMAVRKSALRRHPFRVNILEDYDVVRRIKRMGKVRYYTKLYMAVSSRRLKYGFHVSMLRFYARNFFRLRFGFKEKDRTYWNQKV